MQLFLIIIMSTRILMYILIEHTTSPQKSKPLLIVLCKAIRSTKLDTDSQFPYSFHVKTNFHPTTPKKTNSYLQVL